MPRGNQLLLPEPPTAACNVHSSLNTQQVSISDYFYLRVACDHMAGSDIRTGDILTVDASAKRENGSLVIALINKQLYIRRLKITLNKVLLVSDSPAVAAIEFRAQSGWRICGVVISVAPLSD